MLGKAAQIRGACIAVALFAVPAPVLAEAIVIDGDDILIDGKDYRLEGVDAFEGNQICRTSQGQAELCGNRAKAALDYPRREPNQLRAYRQEA